MSDKPEKKESLTSERCRACWYCGYMGTKACTGPRCCDYFLVTGQLRGCPAGDGCTRFRPGPRPRQLVRIRNRNWELAQ